MQNYTTSPTTHTSLYCTITAQIFVMEARSALTLRSFVRSDGFVLHDALVIASTQPTHPDSGTQFSLGPLHMGLACAVPGFLYASQPFAHLFPLGDAGLTSIPWVLEWQLLS